jgi:hypothetical protein
MNAHTPLNVEVAKYQFGIYGVIVVLMMLFRPVGLIPERRRKRELEEGTHDDPLYDHREAGEARSRALCSSPTTSASSSAACSPSTTSTSRSRSARSSA